MRGSLVVAKKLKLPVDTLTQTIALLAIRGAGKTYTAKVFVEEFLKKRLQTVIIDAVGVWWGLRLNPQKRRHPDGSPFAIPIFGGLYADIPLEPTAGPLLADIVARRRISCILDISEWHKRDQIRFVAEFSAELYRLKNRHNTPMMLVYEESDIFAPQTMRGGRGGGRQNENFQSRCLEAVEDIVRRGRSRGLGVMLISQRHAVINKDVLYMTETLIVMRTAPGDHDAIEGWVKKHGVKEDVERVMRSLASLPNGTGWVWSPMWLKILAKVKFRKIETYDSSKTPKVGMKRKKIGKLTSVDVTRFREQMEATVTRVEQRVTRACPMNSYCKEITPTVSAACGNGPQQRIGRTSENTATRSRGFWRTLSSPNRSREL